MNELVLREKIGFQPFPAQQLVLDCQSRDIAICAGRRFGKSIVSAYLALKTLITREQEKKPCNIWIVAPSYDLTQKSFEYLAKWFLKLFPSQRGGLSFRPFPQIKTARGSKVQCRSAENPTGLLGEEVDLIIADEASRIPRNVFETYLFPTTSS
ncbi:MAG: terminase family protein, partial [Patescibacteria group bacterium]